MFFIKTAQKERLGVIHSSIGSLAFSHLGLTAKKNYTESKFTFAQPAYAKNVNTNLFQGKSSQDTTLTGKTLYEASGSLIACHGQRRKHIKVVNELKPEKAKSTFEGNLVSF